MNPLCIKAQALTSLLVLTLPGSVLACDGHTSISPLPTLGGSQTRLNGLSSAGHVTGYSYTINNASAHAFLYAGGTFADLDPAGSDSSQGIAVNASGQVAGNIGTHSFLYSGGVLTDIGTLGGMFSFTAAMNDAGRITGSSLTADGFFFVAFLYENGTMNNLGTLGGSSSFSHAINQAGVVVGESSTFFDMETHAFLSTNGLMLDLGTLGGGYSAAYAVNDQGLVVGESDTDQFETHGFANANGVMTDLGTLGGTYSSAFAVNSAGQIIGSSSTTADQETHGFIYAAGSMSDLGTLGGDSSDPRSLDNLGRVVGASALADSTQHAFIWQNGAMVDLNTLLPANSGWELTSAEFINDAGRIAGYGLLNGEERAFVMDLGSGDNPPIAAAGNDQSVECSASVVLDASQSFDPDGDALRFEWSENGTVLGTNATFAATFSLGSHQITLTVYDPCGLSSQDSVAVTVVDTTAPTIICPQGITLPVGTDCSAVLPDLTSFVTVSDNCPSATGLSLTQNPPAGSALGLGQHVVTFTAMDASGNSASCSIGVNVVDSIAPQFSSSVGPITVPVVADCHAAMPDLTGLVSAFDNCTPNNALVFAQQPAAGTQLAVGQHSATVTATDSSGNSASTEITLVVADQTAPTILASPASIRISAGAHCQGAVPNVLSSIVASDNCTPASQLVLVQNPSAGTILPTGSHNVLVTVADAAGNTTTTNVTLVIADSTPPDITAITASPNTLSPPNKQIIPVTVSVFATDSCDSAPVSHIIAVTCNETASPGDIQITGDLSVNLVATKNATGTTRVYTIMVQCVDASGNASTGSVNVSVPKSNGNGGGGRKP